MATTVQPARAPGPTSSPYSPPSISDLAAVSVTVALVGVFMALLVSWLAIRLRQVNVPQSFKPLLRLPHKPKDASWDFADPEPGSLQKRGEGKHRPSPLAPTPAYTPRPHRVSTKDDPRTPTTPVTPSVDALESPPPAYCRPDAKLAP